MLEHFWSRRKRYYLLSLRKHVTHYKGKEVLRISFLMTLLLFMKKSNYGNVEEWVK